MEKNYGWNSPNICFISFPKSSERERESENAKEKIKTISSCTLFFLCFSFLRCLYLTYCDLPVSFLTFSFKEQDLKLSAPLCWNKPCSQVHPPWWIVKPFVVGWIVFISWQAAMHGSKVFILLIICSETAYPAPFL